MNIVNLDIVDNFKLKHSNSRNALDIFVNILKNTQCNNTNELKKTFSSVDFVRRCTIFDVGGNKYRVIAKVNYVLNVVSIKYVFLHSDYEKWSKKNECC